MEMSSKRTSKTSNVSGESIASNVDLSTEILLRLPIRSLLRSKCVSRLWRSLITDLRFLKLRNSVSSPNPNPKSPSGLFLERRTQLAHQEYDFVPFDVENPVKPPFKTLLFDKEASTSGISVLHSSNGLMLCRSLCVGLSLKSFVYKTKYYVYNPTVNQFIVLPRFDGFDAKNILGMSLAFNPSKSTHYRVVSVRSLESSHVYSCEDGYQIDVYTSETGKWRVSGDPFPSQIGTEFMGGVYWNDAIHWLNQDGFVCYFKLDDESLHHIPELNIQTEFERTCNRLVESRDCMLLIDVYGPHSCRFNVFEMNRDYSGWCVRYKVDLGGVTEVFPEMYPHGYIFAVHCIVLGEKEDSFVVVEIPGKAIRYNLKLKTFYKLCDFALPDTNNEVTIGDGVLMFGRWQYGRWPGAFLFTESLSLV